MSVMLPALTLNEQDLRRPGQARPPPPATTDTPVETVPAEGKSTGPPDETAWWFPLWAPWAFWGPWWWYRRRH